MNSAQRSRFEVMTAVMSPDDPLFEAIPATLAIDIGFLIFTDFRDPADLAT